VFVANYVCGFGTLLCLTVVRMLGRLGQLEDWAYKS
jgi:hypothetical protein